MDDLLAPTHLILVALLALLLFGPRRLPELAAGLGRAVREFKSSLSGITSVPEEIRASVRAAGEGAPAPPPGADRDGGSPPPPT